MMLMWIIIFIILILYIALQIKRFRDCENNEIERLRIQRLQRRERILNSTNQIINPVYTISGNNGDSSVGSNNDDHGGGGGVDYCNTTIVNSNNSERLYRCNRCIMLESDSTATYVSNDDRKIHYDKDLPTYEEAVLGIRNSSSVMGVISSSSSSFIPQVVSNICHNNENISNHMR